MKWRPRNPYAPTFGLWFAWRPVKCYDGYVRWLEWVWRSRVYVDYYAGGGWDREYYPCDHMGVAEQKHNTRRRIWGARD